MTVYVVAGGGPNDLTIPLVLFATQKEAEDFIEEFPREAENPQWLAEDFSERRGIYINEETFEASEIGKPLYEALFKDGNYYAGCGGCYSLSIIPVEFGQPMVGWDLD